MTGEGFDPAVVALLADLPGMSVDEYAEHKAALAAGVTKPGEVLIREVAAMLDADLTVSARSSVSPLHRDLRFAPTGADRYKDHLLLTTWEGADKKTAPVLWIRIDAARAGFASGIGFTPAIRERWRAAIAGAPGAVLAGELQRLGTQRAAEVVGDRVKQVPPPLPADHPRAELMRHTGFQVRFVDDLPSSLGTAVFVDWCVERLAELLPVHRWLVANLADHPADGADR